MLLSLLCGLACGDRVVVARGLSLVSAAQSSDDAGFVELGFEGPAQPLATDAGAGAADAAAERPLDAGQADAGAGRKPPFFVPRPDGHGDPHDRAPDADPAKSDEPEVGPDAGQARDLPHHSQ